MDEQEARTAIVDVVLRLDAAGLNHGITGNVSVRIDGGMLVTPTGIRAHDLRPEDMVALLDDGSPRDPGGRLPTSEWRLHVALYRRPSVGAIVHTHSLEATAAATRRVHVPAVHYVVAAFGGTILPCAAYATYGSQELADSVAATLGDRYTACLMANHGAVAVAAGLQAAVSRVQDVEWLCGVWRRAKEMGGPVVIDDAELARVAERFRTYGQPR
jgi:L-fuculose-phosphate aldolase